MSENTNLLAYSTKPLHVYLREPEQNIVFVNCKNGNEQ